MNELQLLKYFSAVYQLGSFRRAAEYLGVSQSTLSKGVRRLETEFNLTLFNRTTRSVTPTDASRALVTRVEAVLAAHASLQEDARLLTGGDLGAIRIGAIALASETMLTDCLSRLAVTHPNLDIEVVVGSADIYKDVATGICDAAIGDEANFQVSPHADVLRMTLLREETLVPVHRHGHPAETNPLRLSNFPVAIPSRYFNENRLFNESTASVFSTSPRYRLNSLSACLSLAAATDVVTVAPASLLATTTDQRDLKAANIHADLKVRLILATMARTAPSPAVRAFQQACRAG
jgi:DNA-binding transcriptional LysR family regulator